MANVANILQNANTIANSTTASKEFHDLLRQISEAQTKQEEERYIVAEKARLKAKIGQPNVTSKQMKEFVVRMIYCEMLGHDVSFGYIHAINLTQKSKDMIEKRTGYLAVSLFLHENHELAILLVQTILRDLNSQNHIDISSALTALSRLASKEIIPAVLPAVQTCLVHPKEIVRKKAVICIQRFYQRAPSTVSHLGDPIRRALCDKDPSVMGASVCLILTMAQDNPENFRDLTSTLVSILKTIVDHRISRGYDYHGIPAPWYQIKLLKTLAVLGQDNRVASESMYHVLLDALKKAETGVDASYAILYETITTITTIYPHAGLIAAAAKSISRFLTSTNANLKYLGITALAAIVKVDPIHAAPHQMVVIDCLENPDETIKRKTLDLLYKMTSVSNVIVIVDKMLDFLRTTVDDYMRAELVSRITTLAEKYAPNNQWFVRTMAIVFELGGHLVRPEVADNLIRLIAEGTDDEDLDNELRVQAVTEYIVLLQRIQLPDILMHVVAWVIGEYAYLAQEQSLDTVLDYLAASLERAHMTMEQRGWMISSMMKIVAQLGKYPANVRAIVEKGKRSKDVDLSQRSREFDNLVKDMALMTAVLPVDASCEDIEVDESLSFLDGYVNDALRRGAKRYIAPSQRKSTADSVRAFAEEQAGSKAIRYEAYEAPKPFLQTSLQPEPLTSTAETQNSSDDVSDQTDPNSIIVPESKKKWGKSGYLGKANAPDVAALPPQQQQQQPQQPQQQQQPQTFQSPPAVVESPKEPPVPRAPTEKERLASALFGGLTPASASAAPSTIGSPEVKSKVAKPKTGRLESKPSSELMSLETATGSVFSPTSASAVAAAATSQRTQSTTISMDLLSLDLPSTFTQPTAATTTPQVQTQAQQFDFLSSLTTEENSTLSSFSIDSTGFSLPAELSNLPGADQKPTVLAEDDNIVVRAVKLKQAGVGLVLFFHVSASTGHKLSDVQIRYEINQNFKTAFATGTGTFNANVYSHQGHVSFGQPATNLVRVSFLSHRPLPFVMSAQVSYGDSLRAPRVLPFQILLNIADFIRPLPLVTKEYGAKWVTLTQEIKVAYKPINVTNQTQLMQRMKSQLDTHSVEIIGMEGISAGIILGSNEEVLIHCKLDETAGAIVTVRSVNKALSENVAKELKAVLSN